VVGWKDASSIITADGQVRAPVQYNGMVDAFRKTVKNEGPQALYKGLVPNSVKVRNKLSSLFNVYGGMHMVDAFRKIVKNKR
jgi:solute carrier family 25 phosphate transporter 23/24/25/41